jgi:hypothetical protein
MDSDPLPVVDELQDPELRRDIRCRYRALLNDVSTSRPDLVTGDTLVLKEKIDTTNAIFENVKHPREAALDAQCCSSIAALGKQKVQALATDFCNFSTVEFCEKLITRLGRNLATATDNGLPSQTMDRDCWVRLGTASQTFFKRSPPLHFMFGLLNRERRPVAHRQPRNTEQEKLDKLAAASKPKQSSNFGEQKGESTTVEVENILKILRLAYKSNKRSPICYFEFVTNPRSFSQTIENVFYTSFLIRDGYARIFLDDDGLPVIEPVEGVTGLGDNLNGAMESGESHQMVMPWTVKDWKEVVESFDITRPLIPTRPAHKSGTTVEMTSATTSSVRSANSSLSSPSKNSASQSTSSSTVKPAKIILAKSSHRSK